MHGIRIEFNTEKGYKRTATYLPEVAPEQGEVILCAYYVDSFLSNMKFIKKENRADFLDLSQTF